MNPKQAITLEIAILFPLEYHNLCIEADFSGIGLRFWCLIALRAQEHLNMGLQNESGGGPMHKSMVLFVLLLVIAIGVAVPASAVSLTGNGFILSVTTPESKEELRYIARFMGSQSGPIEPYENTVPFLPGEDVTLQIVAPGNLSNRVAFDIALSANPKRDEWEHMKDDPTYGQWFTVKHDYCPPVYGMGIPLQFKARVHDGVRKELRAGGVNLTFILKIWGGDKKDYTEYSTLYLVPCVSQAMQDVEEEPVASTKPEQCPPEIRQGLDPVKTQRVLDDFGKAFDANSQDHQALGKGVQNAQSTADQALAIAMQNREYLSAQSAPSVPKDTRQAQAELLRAKYADRRGILFAVRNGCGGGAYTVWTYGPGLAPVPQPNTLVIRPGQELIWSKSISSLLAKGYTHYFVPPTYGQADKCPLDPNTLQIILLGEG